MKKSEKLKRTTDARYYTRMMTIDQDPYSEDYGSKRYLVRKFRTWKHNRKTKWK